MFSKDQIESPVIWHQGFPVKGLTRIIALRCNLNSEMPAWCAFRFGIVHSKGAMQFLILLRFIQASFKWTSFSQFLCTLSVHESLDLENRQAGLHFDQPLKRATTLSGYKIGVRQSLDNRTIWPVITMAMIGQMRESVAHVRQFGDAAIEFGDMFERDPLYFGTCTRAVVP
ncbi:hypothetical protein OKW35_008557 [Paraburkholderia sp. MM5477-R1]